MKKLKDKKEPFTYHVWLHSDIGISVSTNNQGLQDHDNNCTIPSGADDFELLIGSLNEVLEEMYGCQICYDKAEKPSEHLSNLVIPEGKTLFDGFAIFVVEDEEKMEDA